MMQPKRRQKKRKPKKQSSVFNVDGTLKEIAEKIDVLPGELTAIESRLGALAVRSYPPDWGYAGMLKTNVEAGTIKNVYDIYHDIGYWHLNPQDAQEYFDQWNKTRLENREKTK